MEDRPLQIDARFNGPPTSGNGGYTAGLLAERTSFVQHGPVQVTLRTPPPLEVPLRVAESGDAAQLLHGDDVIAEATPGSLDAPPAPVSVDVAQAAEAHYPGRDGHAFSTCFACGPDRAAGDGLRLAPGLVSAGHSACTWMPSGSHGLDGVVQPEVLWSALDCPSAWSTDILAQPRVLGRMTAQIVASVPIGEPTVVVGELRSIEGRKALTASALYTTDGQLLAHAAHVWIAVDPRTFGA